MARVKASASNKTSKSMRPALSPEARENQCISLAMDLAEQQLRDGTASSQLITEFVKRGSTKARLEQEMLKEQKELMTAKREAMESAKRIEDMYGKALKAMRGYSGQDEEDEEDENWDD